MHDEALTIGHAAISSTASCRACASAYSQWWMRAAPVCWLNACMSSLAINKRIEGSGRGGIWSLSDLHAQHVPGNVWSKFFTSHLTVCSPFDCWATTRRNRADAASPLPNQLGLASDGKSERCLASRRVVDVFCEVHAAHLKRGAKDSQATRLLHQVSIALAMDGMKTVGEIRRQNLEILVREYGTLAAVAALPEPPTTSVYLSMVRKQTQDRKTKRPRQMGDDLARRIETGAKKPYGWMDTPHPELVVVGTTREDPSIEPAAGGVQEVTESGPETSTGERDIKSQSEPRGIPKDMSTRLHSTVMELGSLLGALDDTSRKIMAVILEKLTEDPDGRAEYAERAVANVKIQRRLVADVELDKKLTALSEVTPENESVR